MANVTPELDQAKARAEEWLLALPGVTGVDIGFKEVAGEPTDQLAIRVLVADKKPIDEVPAEERIPDEIEGQPSDVIQRRFELHSTGACVAVDEVLPPADAASYNPLKGGVSIGPCRVVGGFVHAGTLGAIVVDNASRRNWALSNFHVLAVDRGATVGDTIAQPSIVDGGTCPAQVVGRLGRHALTSAVDAAVMDLADARDVRPEVAEIGALTGTGTASLGQAVHKRGRTTRLTHGVVDSVSLTLRVDYGHDIGVMTLTGQIGVRPDPNLSARFTAKGDSGSVLVGDAREVIGLLFAGDDSGYGVANPIAEVLSALDVNIGTASAAKRVEFLAGKGEPGEAKPIEVKDRFGKEQKADKTEFKDDKDQKNEDKEIKEQKNEDKENKDSKDGKDDKDKDGKDENKDAKDKESKSEGKEFKNESKDDKDKEGKDESKDTKDDKDKPEKDEIKEAKDEHKDNKDDKDAKEKDKDDKDRKDFQIEVFSRSVQAPVEQRIAALESAIVRLTTPVAGAAETRPTKDENALRKELKDLKSENKERPEKQENKDIQPEAAPLRSPIERRVAALEGIVTQLSHFIGRSLRPDLSQGALHREPDIAGQSAALKRDADAAKVTKDMSDTPPQASA